MKKVYVVFQIVKNNKYYAIAETIRAGENIISFCNRYNATVCYLCESRTQAELLAIEWNKTYKTNGTNLY